MPDSGLYEDWYEKAERDLRGAQILFEHDGGYDLVAFHCQQTIEKVLKGWLLKTTNELMEGHSLTYLCRKAISAGADMRKYLKDCAFVNQFYIETRYPSDDGALVSKDEAQECLNIATVVMNELK